MGCWHWAKMAHSCLQCIFWQFFSKMPTSEKSAPRHTSATNNCKNCELQLKCYYTTPVMVMSVLPSLEIHLIRNKRLLSIDWCIRVLALSFSTGELTASTPGTCKGFHTILRLSLFVGLVDKKWYCKSSRSCCKSLWRWLWCGLILSLWAFYPHLYFYFIRNACSQWWISQ